MTERELRAVAEAIIADMYKQYGSPELIYDGNCEGRLEFCGVDIYKSAQAAISASDSKYVKGLMEALDKIKYHAAAANNLMERRQQIHEIAQKALQNLPEDLR